MKTANPTSINLKIAQKKQLDSIAKKRKVSRSLLIGEIFADYFERQEIGERKELFEQIGASHGK